MDDFKKIIFPILAVATFICVIGYIYKSPFNFSSTPTLPKVKVTIGGISLEVEKATTAKERETGLSGRSSLGNNEGMLFFLENKDSIPIFWMKGMKFNLDIIWIKSAKVTQIDKNVLAPEEDAPDAQLKRYSPKEPVEYVLEVNSGFCDENKIKVGDPVQIQPAP